MLMAKVKPAVQKQNGLVIKCSVFHRLRERRIDLYDLVSDLELPESFSRQGVFTSLNCILLEPKYANFLQAAFTLSDEVHKGLLTEMSACRSWCLGIRHCRTARAGAQGSHRKAGLACGPEDGPQRHPERGPGEDRP